MQILENVLDKSVYEQSAEYNFFSIFDRPEILFGAPVKTDRKLRKIAYPEKLIEENGLEQDAALLVANTQNSGVRLRFFTDSPDFIIKVRTSRAYPHQKMTMACSSGFDLYFVNNGKHDHVTVIAQDFGEKVFAHKFELYNKPRNIELFFPLYNTVEEMLVGVRTGSRLEPSPDFSVKGSLIFYGNSRTQGASASRSGNAYPNILARNLDCDIVNYSFSAACRAEESMARQIVDNNRAENRDVAGIVIDYSHNAKDIAEFSLRYGKFYDILRNEYPKCPIILVGAFGRKDYDVFIKEFHNKCICQDEKTFYISLHKLFADLDDIALTPDDLHYSDKGMFLLAGKICEYLRQSAAEFKIK